MNKGQDAMIRRESFIPRIYSLYNSNHDFNAPSSRSVKDDAAAPVGEKYLDLRALGV
jgi:hypothetical protein